MKRLAGLVAAVAAAVAMMGVATTARAATTVPVPTDPGVQYIYEFRDSRDVYTYELTPETANAAIAAGRSYVGVAWAAPTTGGHGDSDGDEVYLIAMNSPTGRVDSIVWSATEKDAILRGEGTALVGSVYKASSEGGRVVYRFANFKPSQDEFFEFRYSYAPRLPEPWVNYGPFVYGLDVEIPANPQPTQDTMNVYRLYNPYSGEHLYTVSEAEKDADVSAGWDYEGVAWRAPRTSASPVYRLFNPYSYEHLYTTDKGERDNLVGHGWKGEGVVFYSSDSDGDPVYRVWNTWERGPGAHVFTVDSREYQTLLSTGGYADEGIGWYGFR